MYKMEGCHPPRKEAQHYLHFEWNNVIYGESPRPIQLRMVSQMAIAAVTLT